MGGLETGMKPSIFIGYENQPIARKRLPLKNLRNDSLPDISAILASCGCWHVPVKIVRELPVGCLLAA
jgi:hypothetical protein